jgi:uncharacterized protein (TIGR03382 family)
MRALVFVLLLSSLAQANAPAPWAVCEGKKPGDSCSGIYYPLGRCVVEDLGCGDHGRKSCLTCRSRGCDIGSGGVSSLAALAGLVGLALLLRRRS